MENEKITELINKRLEQLEYDNEYLKFIDYLDEEGNEDEDFDLETHF
jgi:hypothetical protein